MYIHENMSLIVDRAYYSIGQYENIENTYISQYIKDNNQFPYDTASYYGSRNSGKSHSVYRAVLMHTIISPDNILMLRWIQDSIRQSSFSQLKSIIEQENLSSYFKITNQYIQSLTTGARIEFKGLYQKVDSIRSLSDSFKLLVLEECQQYQETELQSFLATVYRFPDVLVVPIFNVNFINNPAYKRFVTNGTLNPKAITYLMNYYDNQFHTNDCAMERQRLIDKDTMDTESYNAEWMGIPRTSLKSAIFQKSIIDKLFDIKPFTLESTFISYDPAVTDKNNVDADDISNSHGVCIFGITKNKELVLLEAINIVDNPSNVCDMINNKYNEYKCNYTIFESNMGGLFVKQLLLSKNSKMICKEFRSTSNKVQRATSLVNVINDSKVFISETCDSKALIDQMNRMSSGGFIRNYKNESPDILDAFGFALIDFFRLNQLQSHNTVLPALKAIPQAIYHSNIIITNNLNNQTFAICAEVYTRNSNKYIKVINYYIDLTEVFSIDKQYDSGFLIAKCNNIDYIKNARLLKELDSISNNMKYLSNVEIEITNEYLLTLWNEYTTDKESSIELQCIFHLIKLVSNMPL